MAKAKKKADRRDLSFDEFVKRPPELTVLTDHPLTPAEAFKADTFNFRYKLGPVFDILRHPVTKTPTAILISGDWGTGKTSAMRWLQGLLEKWNQEEGRSNVKVRPVWFYPWKYDNKADVRRGLIAEVIINAIYIRNPEDKKITISGKKILTGLKLLGSFGLNVVSDLVSASEYEIPTIPGLKVSGEALKEIRKHFSEAAHPEAAFLNELEEAMKHWVKESLGKNQRMVIFIDDLDRCMPEIALQVLEALKLYLNIPNLVFILGVDRDVVEKLVVGHYSKLGLIRDEEKAKSEQDNTRRHQDEEKAKQYLSKMFQVEVELEPTEQQISDFFTEQLEVLTYWNEEYLSTYEQELFRDLVLNFASRNPREVKRLLNSALMTGVGAIMMKKDGIKFNQGLQLFFVRKILDERYTMASEAGSKRGIEFFVQWSKVVCEGKGKNKDFPYLIDVPNDYCDQLVQAREDKSEGTLEYVSERMKRKIELEKPSFAPPEYYPLLQNPMFSGLFHLLADNDLGQLMQIPYPPEVAEITDVIGTSKDVDIIREAVARELKKEIDDLTDDDYVKTKELNLSGLWIADISSLKYLPNLEKLFLGETQISNIRALKDLTNLKWLSLRQTQISDIGVLAGLTMLQDLNLFGTKVSDIGVLSGLTNLQVLSLAGTKVSDIGVLSSLTNLQELSISRTRVKDIHPIKELNKLQILYLHHTKISNISPLAGITSLQSFDLSGTQISDINILSGLTKLQKLSLADTKVNDIGVIAGLINLQMFDLRGTQVSDINVLMGIPNLQWLNLFNTNVGDISVLGELKNLQWLNLSGTNVSDINVLYSLTSLQELWLYDTKVSDEQVAELKKALPELKIVR